MTDPRRPGSAAPPEAGSPRLEPPAVDDGVFTVELDWRRWWTLLPELVALTCAGLLPLLVGANVVARYTNWYRVLWAEDVVKVLFVWVAFLGGAVAVKHGAHVRISMLSDRLAGRAGASWERVSRASPLIVGLVLLILGVRVVGISMHRELPTLQIPSGYFVTVIPASGALMILYARGRARWPR